MLKKFCVGLLTFALMTSTADAARYFMQGDSKGVSTPYGDNVKVGKYAQTSDAKIYYEVYGKGQPVAVLHGGGVGSPYELGQLIDGLKKNHQVIVISTRGHGKSEIGNTPLTFKQKADDIIAVLDAVGVNSVEVLGFSDGAYTAYELAVDYPERVERIVAIGAGTLQKGFFGDSMNIEDFAKIDPAFVDYQNSIMPEPERWQEFCNKYISFWHNAEVNQNTFANIKCPVLLVVGDEDDHAPVITVLQAHQLIPNSRLCVIPKAWHSAFLDNYQLTSTAIFDFLNSPLDSLTPSKKVDFNSK